MHGILFDLFGTLITVESDDNAHKALSKKLAEIHGYSFPWEEHFRLYNNLVHGKEGKLTSSQGTWKALIMLAERYRFEVKVSYDDVNKLHLEYHIRFAEPYKDTVNAIIYAKRLCGKIGIITDADREMAYGILKHIGVLDYLDVVVTSEEYGVNKPNPRLFLAAVEKMGVEPSKCAVIGDSWKDVEGAKRAGMKAILVKRRDVVLTVEPDYIAKDLSEAVEKAIELLRCSTTT